MEQAKTIETSPIDAFHKSVHEEIKRLEKVEGDLQTKLLEIQRQLHKARMAFNGMMESDHANSPKADNQSILVGAARIGG